MDLRHLKHFICVAEELHFGRAAIRLHIEQSPLSRSIKDLENDLGVKLLDRTTRSTRLTDAGEAFLHEAKLILSAVDAAKLNARNTTSPTSSIRLAIIDNFAQFFSVELISACRKEDPTLQLFISELPKTHLLDSLNTGKIDAAISPEPIENQGYVSIPLWSDSLATLISVNDKLAGADCITLSDIITSRLIVLKPLSYKFVIGLLRDNLANSEHITFDFDQVSNLEMLLLCVSSGCGIGLATKSQLLKIQHPNIIVRTLQSPPSVLTSYLVTLTKHTNKIKTLLRCAQYVKNAARPC